MARNHWGNESSALREWGLGIIGAMRVLLKGSGG